MYRTVQAAAGTLETEAKAKGTGFLRKAALGQGSSTLVSAATYQQLFKPLGTGGSNFLDSLTLQFVQQLIDGTDDIDTFLGCTMASVEWKMDKAGILTESYTVDARNMVKIVSKAAASPSARNRFSFGGFTAFTNTLTEPTATVLGSATDPIPTVRSFSLKVTNSLVVDDYRGDGTGLKSQPAVESQEITGELELDYNAQALGLRNNWVNNSGLTPLLFNFSTGVALGTGVETVQFCLPAVKFTGKATPNRDGKLPQIKIPFKAFKLASASSALLVAVRTADAAL